eukprot:gene1805-biopygen1683
MVAGSWKYWHVDGKLGHFRLGAKGAAEAPGEAQQTPPVIQHTGVMPTSNAEEPGGQMDDKTAPTRTKENTSDTEGEAGVCRTERLVQTTLQFRVESAEQASSRLEEERGAAERRRLRPPQGGSRYSQYEMEEQMGKWDIDVAVIIETKTVNAEIMRHFRNSKQSNICTNAPKSRSETGEDHQTVGLAVILRGEYAKPHNYTEVKVPHLQGVLTHTILHFPGARYQHMYATDKDHRGELSTSSGAFVDDLIILTRLMTGMELQLKKRATFGDWSGLHINTDKSKITGVEHGNRSIREDGHQGVKCGSQTLNVLKAGETYKYLGVRLNMRGTWKEEKSKSLQELRRRIEALLATPLTQKQKEHSLKPAVLGKFRRVYIDAEMEGTTRTTKYLRRMDEEYRDPQEQPMARGFEKPGTVNVIKETKTEQATKEINFTKLLTLFRNYPDLKYLTTTDGKKEREILGIRLEDQEREEDDMMGERNPPTRTKRKPMQLDTGKWARQEDPMETPGQDRTHAPTGILGSRQYLDNYTDMASKDIKHALGTKDKQLRTEGDTTYCYEPEGGLIGTLSTAKVRELYDRYAQAVGDVAAQWPTEEQLAKRLKLKLEHKIHVDSFEEEIAQLLIRYSSKAEMKHRKRNLQNHWTFPPEMMEAVHEAMGARTEVFASPLNVHKNTKTYYSQYPRDSVFGHTTEEDINGDRWLRWERGEMEETDPQPGSQWDNNGKGYPEPDRRFNRNGMVYTDGNQRKIKREDGEQEEATTAGNMQTLQQEGSWNETQPMVGDMREGEDEPTQEDEWEVEEGELRRMQEEEMTLTHEKQQGQWEPQNQQEPDHARPATRTASQETEGAQEGQQDIALQVTQEMELPETQNMSMEAQQEAEDDLIDMAQQQEEAREEQRALQEMAHNNKEQHKERHS